MNLNINRLNQLFLDLTSIDAPSFSERQAANAVKIFLNELGLDVSEDKTADKISGNCGNLLCKIPVNWAMAGLNQVGARAQDCRPTLLLSTHLDTVEPCLGKKISLNDDGIFRSDGTTILGADDYSGVAAILEAIRLLRENPQPHRALELLFSVAEEAHLKGISAFDAASLDSKEGYVLDTCGTPGDGVIAAPGHNHLVFQITGRSAHAGIAPETGINAIAVAAKGIAAMKLGRIDAETTANIGQISGGGATNIISESCTVTAECRSLDAAKLALQTEGMCAAMTEAARFAGAQVEITLHTSYYPYQVSPEEPVAQRFLQACLSLGIKPRLIATGGGSDMNVLSKAGIRGMVLSCGMQQVHSNQEFLAASDLADLTKLVLELILSPI